MAALPESRTPWSEARRLFHAVVDLDPAARELVLARHTERDGVVAEVRSLLEWHGRDPGFLDRWRPRPAAEAAASSCTTLSTDPEVRGPKRTE